MTVTTQAPMAGDARRETGAAAATAVAKRGRPSRRVDKRAALLDGATALFNARGIAATSLGDIAEAVGLSRATLYYYVDDRAGLVFQCYWRACELTADDLAAAADAPNGFERTLAFVRRALTIARSVSAVLSEINYLPVAQADTVRAANDRNVAALIGFIEEGTADGSIRNCDCEVIAQSIIGILSWANLSPQWVMGPRGRSFRARLLVTMEDLLRHGVARDRSGGFSCDIDAKAFLSGPFNAFDRRQAAEMKTEQLLVAASRLFNRNGIEGTSLDEIVASLGASKGALYHYLRDKDDLIARCYERAFALFEAFADTASARTGSGLERALVGIHLNTQAQAGPLSPLMPQPGLDALPQALRVNLAARGKRLNTRLSQLLRTGMADGSSRPCDSLIVAQIGAGAFGWLPKWLAPDDSRTPRALADEISNFYFQGIATA